MLLINHNSKKIRRIAAFTLTEVMVSMAIFTMVMAAVMLAHITGLKMFNLTASKLSSTEGGRRALGLLDADIRAAKTIMVGTGTNIASFASIPDGTAQQGASLLVYSSTNTTNCILYFYDTSDKKLKRITNLLPQPKVVAEYITNNVLFFSETFGGNVVTDNDDNRVIRVRMQFYQVQYPVMAVGPHCFYNYYEINTRVTRRMLE